MNDNQKKMLMEYLGETGDNRPFTTPADLHALVCGMVERGDWPDFTSFSYPKWGEYCGDHGYPHNRFGGYVSWLITDPSRTCDLIAEWLEAQ